MLAEYCKYSWQKARVTFVMLDASSAITMSCSRCPIMLVKASPSDYWQVWKEADGRFQSKANTSSGLSEL